jgi:predicted nucleic acid-binding protein
VTRSWTHSSRRSTLSNLAVGEPDLAEVVLCDTSYLSQLAKAERDPAVIGHWPEELVARLAIAIPTISVITVAEIRAGWEIRRWSERRRVEAAQRLAAYAWIPLDYEVLDEWARLQADARAEGITGASHNDVWIAATAVVRGYPLVACDAIQCSLPRVRDLVIHLPSDETSRGLR